MGCATSNHVPTTTPPVWYSSEALSLTVVCKFHGSTPRLSGMNEKDVGVIDMYDDDREN